MRIKAVDIYRAVVKHLAQLTITNLISPLVRLDGYRQVSAKIRVNAENVPTNGLNRLEGRQTLRKPTCMY
jgi:hypothetical protein